MNVDPVVWSHLLGMAVALRRAPPPADLVRARRRAAALDRLATYAASGRFPQNRVGVRTPREAVPGGFVGAFEDRAPIFVDDAGTPCAVAHVVGGTDAPLVARVQAACNDAWLAEMPVPELAAWADHHGFTLDELRRVQPSYEPLEVPVCDGAAPVAYAVDVDPDFATGVDLSPDALPAQTCFVACDGPLRVWLRVFNTGGVSVTDARVEVWVDGVSALVDDALAVDSGATAIVGPIEIPNAETARVTMSVTSPDDADPSDDASDVYLAEYGLECARDCGCAPRGGHPGVAVLPVALALLRRRRAP